MLKYNLIAVDCDFITDWDSFFDTFAKAFGFPDFFGRNMDAWIDCMTSLDDPDGGLTAIHAPKDGCFVLELANVTHFKSRCPDQFGALIECSAFVNWRRIEIGEPPVLVISFNA